MKTGLAERIAVLITVCFIAATVTVCIAETGRTADFSISAEEAVYETDTYVLRSSDAEISVPDPVRALDEPEGSDLVDINTASAEELCTLPSVGEVLAGRIIEYREQYGEFREIEDIMRVYGIGEGVFTKIKDHITV